MNVLYNKHIKCRKSTEIVKKCTASADEPVERQTKEMAVVKELIRTEENGAISFGDYELAQKSKLSDYQHQGDMYKVKTFKEITKLERNGMFVYESVPGTAVFNLTQSEAQMDFHVEGPEDAQITVEMEPDTEYEVFIEQASAGKMKTNLGGKLSFSVELGNAARVEVKIVKC